MGANRAMTPVKSGKSVMVGRLKRNSAWLPSQSEDSRCETEHRHLGESLDCLEEAAVQAGTAEALLCIGQAEPEQQGGKPAPELRQDAAINGKTP